MKKQFIILLSLLILIASSCNQKKEVETITKTTENQYDVNKKLEELNIKLTEPGTPKANYLHAVRVGNLVFLAGHGPAKQDGILLSGKLGKNLTIAQGQAAARLTGISLLSSLQAEIGDLNKVKRIVRATGMVNADSSFTQHPAVINGFSDLMVAVFGEKGKHARAAVGMSSLPWNIPVEIQMIVEIEE